MTLEIIMWVVIGLFVLGLFWFAYQIFQSLQIDPKTLPLKERLVWKYPSIVAPFIDIEYETSEGIYVIDNLPPHLLENLKRSDIDFYNIQIEDNLPFSGIVLRGSDVPKSLQLLNLTLTRTRLHSERKDLWFAGVETADPELRLTMLLEKYYLDLRAVHTEGDEKVLTARRAYQDILSQIVKLQREIADYELGTESEEVAKRQWAAKIYDDVLHHPDILRIDLQEKRDHITIYTDDVIVMETGTKPRSESRSPKVFFLGKLKITINLSTGDVRYYHEEGHMRGSTKAIPHVNEEGNPCWGSHADVVKRALNARDYLKAIQEAINFAKYANTADNWGSSALGLKILSDNEIQSIERKKLQRAKKRSEKTTNLSSTSMYIVEHTKQRQQLLDELKIKYLIIDEDFGYGFAGLLIRDKEKINLFVEKALGLNETIRTDPTSQNGVRKLSFAVDDQQTQFINLLLASWQNRSVNMVNNHIDTMRALEKNLAEKRDAYLKTAAGRHKSVLQMTNEKIKEGMFSFLYKDMYRSLILLPDVEAVVVKDNKIIITTHELYVKEAKKRPRATEVRCYNLGKMRIEIDLFMTTDPIKCFRINGTLPKSEGLLQAPHVLSSGIPMWGVQELRMLELIAKGQLIEVTKETIKFLQVARYDDSHGKYVQYLPEVDILELPTLELSKIQAKEAWMEERKKEQEERQKLLYEEILLTQNAETNSAQNP